MVLIQGDIWDYIQPSVILLFTANSYIDSKGRLVMGKGFAREVKERFPGIEEVFGRNLPHLGEYGLFIIPSPQPAMVTAIGAFQVKHHFRDPADLTLIQKSIDDLQIEALKHPYLTYFLNFPGIGAGGLGRYKKKILESMRQKLPGNVIVFEKP